jgi:CheY-like chemotaxis protein
MNNSPTDIGGSPLPSIVLVVDPHADTLEMYDVLMSACGYWVASASNGREAFEYAQDVNPDAMIADLDMPGAMTGIELVQAIRSGGRRREIPIVGVTTRELGDMGRFTDLRLSAILVKPVAPDQLIACVQKALEPPRRTFGTVTDFPASRRVPEGFARMVRDYP